MDKTISRGICVAAAFAFAVSLAGCSSGGTSNNNASTSSNSLNVVTRWASGSPEAEAQGRILDAFTASTGITLNMTEGLETIDDQVETMVAAGKAPDLVIVNLFDKTLSWLDAGVTVAADQYLENWGLASKIKTQAIDEWRVGSVSSGQLQGLPYSGFSWPVWWNTDLLAQAGVTSIPTTTDQLKDAAAKLRAAGIGPVVVGGNDWTGQKLFYQIAESFTSPAAMEKVMTDGGYCDTSTVMDGINLFVNLRDSGVFVDNVAGMNADDMYATYYSEKAAVMSAGSWAYAGAVEAATGVEDRTQLGGFPIPAASMFAKPSSYQGFTGVGFMITKQGAADDKIDMVRQLVQAFYDDANVGDFVKTASILPPTLSDFTSYATNPLLAQSMKLDSVVSYAVLPDVWIGAASDPIIQVLTGAYGKSTADQICAGLDQATKG